LIGGLIVGGLIGGLGAGALVEGGWGYANSFSFAAIS